MRIFPPNAASQIVSRTTSNDAYANSAHYDVDRNYAINGLNQYIAAGPAAFTYDPNGNLTSDGAVTFTYDVENRLVQASGARNAELIYDPLGRLWEINSGTNASKQRLLYDGDALVAEYNDAGVMTNRYVHGTGADRPYAWYTGSTVSAATRRHLFANWQGSIALIADATGATVAVNAYDAYGIPNTTNLGRFQYTGQIWIPELGLYHYKARAYSPTLGRFLQTDPIGYEGGIGLYVYALNDPINLQDRTGLTPGDRFQTPREAGEDAVISVNPRSIEENKEYSGTIERHEGTAPTITEGSVTVNYKNLTYSATQPAGGDGDSASISVRPSTTVGDYHTHGDYSTKGQDGEPVRVPISDTNRAAKDQYDSDNFSSRDTQNTRLLADATQNARQKRNESYTSVLGTPSTKIRTKEVR